MADNERTRMDYLELDTSSEFERRIAEAQQQLTAEAIRILEQPGQPVGPAQARYIEYTIGQFLADELDMLDKARGISQAEPSTQTRLLDQTVANLQTGLLQTIRGNESYRGVALRALLTDPSCLSAIGPFMQAEGYDPHDPNSTTIEVKQFLLNSALSRYLKTINNVRASRQLLPPVDSERVQQFERTVDAHSNFEVTPSGPIVRRSASLDEQRHTETEYAALLQKVKQAKAALDQQELEQRQRAQERQDRLLDQTRAAQETIARYGTAAEVRRRLKEAERTMTQEIASRDETDRSGDQGLNRAVNERILATEQKIQELQIDLRLVERAEAILRNSGQG
jgi:hypothetical protein